jgi:uncharacterized protein
MQRYFHHKTLQTLICGVLLLCLQVSYAQFTIPPKPKSNNARAVYDYINLLSSNEKATLENKLIKYSDTTSTQIVIAIIESTQEESIGMLTPEWAHEWGIVQEGKDNGVMILLSRGDRKIWISPGYGAENRLTAGIVGEITRNRIIPFFKKGDYYGGLNAGVDSIIEVLAGEFTGERRQSDDGIPSGVVFFLIIFFIVLISILGNNKRNGGGRNNRGGRRRRRGSVAGDILDVIILSNLGKGSFGSGSGSSGGSFGGGGFSGGFGGGGFSGGGAGGSW